METFCEFINVSIECTHAWISARMSWSGGIELIGIFSKNSQQYHFDIFYFAENPGRSFHLRRKSACFVSRVLICFECGTQWRTRLLTFFSDGFCNWYLNECERKYLSSRVQSIQVTSELFVFSKFVVSSAFCERIQYRMAFIWLCWDILCDNTCRHKLLWNEINVRPTQIVIRMTEPLYRSVWHDNDYFGMTFSFILELHSWNDWTFNEVPVTIMNSFNLLNTHIGAVTVLWYDTHDWSWIATHGSHSIYHIFLPIETQIIIIKRVRNDSKQRKQANNNKKYSCVVCRMHILLLSLSQLFGI